MDGLREIILPSPLAAVNATYKGSEVRGSLAGRHSSGALRLAGALSVAVRNFFHARNLQPTVRIVHRAVGLEFVTLFRDDLETRPLFIGQHVADVNRSIAAADVANDFH